ncbi:MAG: hypothetical protein AB1791_15270 [Chloroflexota bacterium]
MRGLIDRKGEIFAYLQGTVLYTLDGQPTGRLEGDYVVDTAGTRVWRIIGDGVYTVDGLEAIGYLGEPVPPEYED